MTDRRVRETAPCEHLASAPERPAAPTAPVGCEECLQLGWTWVHLRQCLECEHIGCCDFSIGKHATAHFDATGHPVIRSLEHGETWRWCYVDDAIG